jgi:hypothetical protein
MSRRFGFGPLFLCLHHKSPLNTYRLNNNQCRSGLPLDVFWQIQVLKNMDCQVSPATSITNNSKKKSVAQPCLIH